MILPGPRWARRMQARACGTKAKTGNACETGRGRREAAGGGAGWCWVARKGDAGEGA